MLHIAMLGQAWLVFCRPHGSVCRGSGSAWQPAMP